MNRCYTESDVIAESRGWNAMSGDNDVVCVLWICVVVGTESYVCDQLPKLPEEPPPIGDCAEHHAERLVWRSWLSTRILTPTRRKSD